jgi:hypothetical protein
MVTHRLGPFRVRKSWINGSDKRDGSWRVETDEIKSE